MNFYYSWKTKKVKNGFEFRVFKNLPRKTKNAAGLYADIELIKKGVCKTRARAKGAAQRWTRYYKQEMLRGSIDRL